MEGKRLTDQKGFLEGWFLFSLVRGEEGPKIPAPGRLDDGLRSPGLNGPGARLCVHGPLSAVNYHSRLDEDCLIAIMLLLTDGVLPLFQLVSILSRPISITWHLLGTCC